MKTFRKLSALLLCVFAMALAAPPLHARGVVFGTCSRGIGGGTSIAERPFYEFDELDKPGGADRASWAEKSDGAPLAKSHFRSPRHDLATLIASERRGRFSLPGAPRSYQDLYSDEEMRVFKDAEKASLSALRHTMKSYGDRFVRDITEGGKDVVSEVYNLKDWVEALPSAVTD